MYPSRFLRHIAFDDATDVDDLSNYNARREQELAMKRMYEINFTDMAKHDSKPLTHTIMLQSGIHSGILIHDLTWQGKPSAPKPPKNG